jgi:hypothetical protein
VLNLPSPSDTDRLPPPDTTPYFLRCAAVLRAAYAEAAVRGVTPAA